MGTFINMLGEVTISEEHRPELARRVLEIFRRGGMMRTAEVCLFDRKVTLLCPPTFDKFGELEVNYNYFEDYAWEDCRFNANTGKLSSGKVGWLQFNWVVAAAYLQVELMSETPCFYWCDGPDMFPVKTAGWLNGLFNEHYDLSTRKKVWPVFVAMREELSRNTYERIMDEMIPRTSEEGLDQLGYFAYAAVHVGCESFRDTAERAKREKPDMITSAEAILKAKGAIAELLRSSGMSSETVIDFVLDVVRNPTKENEQLKESPEKVVVGYMLLAFCRLLPPQAIVQALAECVEQDFWTLWPQIVGQTGAWEALSGEDPHLREPIPTVSTEDFLLEDPDDMLLFWTDDSDIEPSQACKDWFWDLSERYNRLMAEEEPLLSVRDFIRKMMDDLRAACQHYDRAYATSDMFYEFLEHASEKKYQVWWKMFSETIDENWNELGRRIEDPTISGQERRNPPSRRLVRRFLALLGIPSLRREVFGE